MGGKKYDVSKMMDDRVDLKRWVFNTEAHPLPINPEILSCYKQCLQQDF